MTGFLIEKSEPYGRQSEANDRQHDEDHDPRWPWFFEVGGTNVH